MALTTAVEIELRNASLLGAFEEQLPIWKGMAREAFKYTRQTVSGPPKRDDVAPHLALALQTRDEFLILKDDKSLRAKKWFVYFADLIVERTWTELQEEEGDEA